MTRPHASSRRRRALAAPVPAFAVFVAFAALAALAAPALAQEPPVFGPTEQLSFDDPESWAMAWFGSVTLLTGFGVPEPLAPGTLELGLEGGWVPSLSEEQRRVGFGGTKVEDLNRTPVIGRPRLTVGLPGGYALTGAWIPPVEVDDVETNLFALALSRELWAGNRTRGGFRLYGQTGTVEGAITCTAEDAAGAPGSEANPFGCEAASNDELTLTYWGFELSLAYRAAGGTEPYLAAAYNQFDNEFQVDALTFGLHDRTRLLADGGAWSVAGGVVHPLGARSRLAGEVFYTPLEVRRRNAENEFGPAETDELLNVRLLLTWRLR